MPIEKTNSSGAPIVSGEDAQGGTLVSCAACLTEIPEDVALTHEGPDYIQHFCGLDCLARWQHKPTKKA